MSFAIGFAAGIVVGALVMLITIIIAIAVMSDKDDPLLMDRAIDEARNLGQLRTFGG
jgi:hypothetical protein